MRFWALSPIVAACATPPTSVRDDCGITERVPYGWTERLTDRCIARLARDVGLDWTSFGVEPSELRHRGSSPAALIISGLYTVAAADTGLGSVLSRDPTPLTLQSEFLSQPKDDASDFWYEMVTRRIDHTVFQPDVPPQDHLASYSAAELRLSVADLTRLSDLNPSAPAPLLPLDMAATLVHEAAHAYVPRHNPGSQSLDLDNNGANGVEATWLYEWLIANGATVPAVDRNAACGLFAGVCRHIAVEYHPCERLPVVCADGLPQSAPQP
jgi:hypothetical protein